MKRSPLWREFESGDGTLLKLLRAAVLAGGAGFLFFAVLAPMGWQGQVVLALLTLGLALWVHRGSKSHLATLMLMLLSAFSTLRYGWWRAESVVAFLRDPGANALPLDVLFILLLLAAEGYAFVALLLGYMQAMWPLKRAPAPLPDDPEEWPAVDLLIPTLNEPLEVVRFTALAALNIDWPAEKLNIYLLDDGGREEFLAFAAEAGIGYLARGNHRGAKAGNINHALEQAKSPFVAIFDCDQAPTRSFLQLTMGWFLRDAKLALVQTPHRFYSPDPLERNLDQFHAIPGEGQLFHGVVQDGNDLWNAASFCGSCAVLRRSALDEVGGLATETVTEDAHTSLRLQRRGWNTAYINIPQAAGLATERLSGYVRQRIRWARGMVQILRTENPLLASGLSPSQRLCYFNSMAHFLCALPRLVFLTAPVIYLVFGRTTIPGVWMAIAAYAVPHLLLANLTHARIYGQHRHSFWNEIYETVMAPYILLPTLVALVAPKRGGFKVTAKGGVVERDFYDARVARPHLLLLAVNLVALACAIPRLVPMHMHDAVGWRSTIEGWLMRLYTGADAGAVWINVAWALFNLMVLGVVASAARESRQRRRSVRMAMAVPSDVILADGSIVQGVTCDLSSGGVRARAGEMAKAKAGDTVQFIFPLLDGSATLAATVVSAERGEIRAQFGPLGLKENEALTVLLYSRADSWLGWGESTEADRPLRSLGRMLRLSLRGLWQALGGGRRGKRLGASIAPLLLVALVAGGAARDAPAAVASAPSRPSPEAQAGVAATQAAPNLGLLPQPFLDPGAKTQTTVPLVFATAPSVKEMQAAGIVSSWLGVLSGPHGVRLAVSIGTIPAGNAIVFAEGAAQIPAGLGVSSLSGATVAMHGNPNDPNSSVLLVAGNDADQLLTAAMALALHGDTWHGPQASITNFVRPAARAPDDAPRWLSTEKVAGFGEAQIGEAQIGAADAGQSGELQGDGSALLNATLRLPPDLNYGDRKNLALHLDYRYNGVPLGDGSTMQVFMNGAYVSSTPMPHTDKASEALGTVVPVPVADLRPFANTLSFQFDFHPAQGAQRGAGSPANLEGAVLKDSTLDISGILHWTELPNLELFASAGYPFTRRADLADAAVVLPDAPTTRELEMFLAMMAHFGAQTGLPAVNVTVTNAAGMTTDGAKDYLVLGTAADQPALQTLDTALPVGINASGLRVRDAEGMFGGTARGWLSRWLGWRVGDAARFGASFGSIETVGELPDAVIEGVEWPRGSGRTVVAVALRDDAAAAGFADAFEASAQSQEIAQSVSVRHGARFSSYRLGSDSYWVGTISPLQRMEYLLGRSPWLIAMVAAIFCFLIATLVQARLRRRARERLQGSA